LAIFTKEGKLMLLILVGLLVTGSTKEFTAAAVSQVASDTAAAFSPVVN
jgi:hypothetical protein